MTTASEKELAGTERFSVIPLNFSDMFRVLTRLYWFASHITLEDHFSIEFMQNSKNFGLWWPGGDLLPTGLTTSLNLSCCRDRVFVCLLFYILFRPPVGPHLILKRPLARFHGFTI